MSVSQRASNLSPEQISLLVERFKDKSGGVFRAPSIPRRSEPAQAPLSFGQQRLWFIDQLDPNSSAYIVPLAYRFNGHFDVVALERAVGEIIRRHEVLRTIFTVVDGQPVQIINPAQAQTVPIIDLSELGEDSREVSARLIATQEARRPFDLRADIMFRALVIRLGAEDHVLLFSLHHIACDGWSFSVLLREIGVLYRSYGEGQPSPLAELPIQYADFAHWQRNWLDGQVLSQQLNYWKEQLSGAAPLELPTDRPRPPALSYRGAVETLLLEKGLVESLRELSQRQGVTMFMLLLAAFKVLLMRYTGQEDISVGTPISGRNWMEIEGLIGFFVNTLVLRTEVRGEESFAEVVQRVREVALDGYAHQDVPFEKLVEGIQPERDASRQPLFQVMFALNGDNNQPTGKGGSGQGMALNPFDCDYTTTRYDLELFITDDGNGFVGKFVYNTDLFNSATIARMLLHFRNLLVSIVSNPKQVVSTLPLLADNERQRILRDWNDTVRPFPSHLCVHQLFEAQVQTAPEATALIFEDTELSYGELNERANRLAHRLRRLGVRPEQRVAILMERNPQLIVGLLAILKAGGAYLPLDPEYPVERLAFMLADADVRVLLTQQHLAATVTGDGVEVVCVDTDWLSIETEESSANPENIATADNLAYVIYTSGSTGVPKGVEVTHKNVARLLFGVEYARFEGRRRILQMASVSFDASTFEIWGALLHGGCCVLYPERVPSFTGIASSVGRHGIDLMWLTASLFNAVVDEAPASLAGVKQLLVGGEALSVGHVRRAQEMLSEVELTNGYGPTESTTFACCHRIEAVQGEERGIAIGRPIGNTQVYILDRWLEAVGVGVCGELYIGGEGLARGYLHRPELTAERFVPHPYGERGGERLYRTGDVCRYREDGAIEYVGRMDGQVKVRGHRIELGEIEAAMGQLEGVREVVVAPREDEPGEKRLVAYVVCERGRELKTATMRKQLQEKLPEYMIPAAVVEMEELPLTANGKVDQRRLPAPEAERLERVEEQVAPQTEVEKVIRRIWEEVLGVERVGVRENFFDLGGHSLLMVQVHGRLQETYGEGLSMTELFKYPTVSALAEHLSSKKIEEQTEPQTIEVSEKLSEGKDRMRQRLEQRQRAAALRSANE
jgi:amino acid adenylation domain-containing protein